LYGTKQLFYVKNGVLEKNPATGAETNAIRKQLQAAMDRMPAEGQRLLKFDLVKLASPSAPGSSKFGYCISNQLYQFTSSP